jgi:hypothetical protein
MTDQVNTPEAGAQSQETTSEVENLAQEHETQEVEGSEQQQEEQQQQQQQPKVVPLAALHEERQKRKEQQERIRMMEERFTQLQNIVAQRLTPQQQQQQQPEIPDVAVDPVGHFKARAEMLEREINGLRQPIQEMRQQTEQERQVAALRNHVTAQEAQFVQAKPDYYDALSHMQALSVQGIKALGYSDQQAVALASQEYLKMAYRIASQGENVAEHVYQMALANGYQGKQQQASGQDQLQSVKKIAGAAKSLGSGGGVSQKLSLQALAEMPADDFAKAVSDDEFRKLFGG